MSSAGLHPPEAIILDLLLPDGRGTDVCRDLRTWTEAPIILVSAVGDEDEKVAALDAGADDYVTKPFAIGELLARLRAALRRAGRAAEPTLTIDELVVDLDKRAVTMRGNPSTSRRMSSSCFASLRRTRGSCSRTRRSSARSGGRPISWNRATSTSSYRNSVASSRPTRHARSTSTRRPARGIAS